MGSLRYGLKVRQSRRANRKNPKPTPPMYLPNRRTTDSPRYLQHAKRESALARKMMPTRHGVAGTRLGRVYSFGGVKRRRAPRTYVG